MTTDEAADVGSAGGPGHDVIELAATVVLGLAVLAIAWASLQSSLWGGRQAKATTRSVLLRSQANDQFQQADGIKSLDQTLFVEYLTTCAGDEQQADTEVVCEQILANMSPAGTVAVETWSIDEVEPPFGSAAYEDSLYLEAEEDMADSELDFADAGAANTNGDRYETAASSLAIVLFLGGISLVVAWRRLRWLLLGGATVVLVWAGVYLISLPKA